mgnify:CR=1 FL=1
MIQAAVALYHAKNENWAGNRKLSASALDHLEKGRADSSEIDIDLLKDRILEFEIEVQKAMVGTGITLPYYKLPRK